jgi:uncharacterized protein (DUF488 family)
MIEKIKVKILRVDEPSFFHDSRKDARTLGTVVNLLIRKMNELIDENNRLREEIKVERSVATDAR